MFFHTDFAWNDTRYMFKIIEENESLKQEEIKRQVDCILAVVRYCYNTTDCRRKLVLKHFGQDFNPKDCGKKCDTCKENPKVIQEDMTLPGQQAIRLIQSMCNLQKNGVSKTQCLDVFRGSKARTVIEKGYDQLQLFGVGQDLSRDRADRLIDELLHRGALKEKCYSNMQGWNNVSMVVSLIHRLHWISL